MATGTSAVEATLEVAVRQTDTFSSLTSQPTQPSVCEFGITTAVDFVRSERMAIRNEGSASFEVGRRFLRSLLKTASQWRMLTAAIS